jgi:hypothetical protein
VADLLFADDTSICYSHSDPAVLVTVLNEAIQNIDLWMKTNKLSVNIDKTNYIIFQSKQKKITQDLSRKQQVKFLGVNLDENLSWKPHIY